MQEDVLKNFETRFGIDAVVFILCVFKLEGLNILKPYCTKI